MNKQDISKLILKDREERKGKNFEGTFLDYLEIIKKDPDIAMLAHQRMYNIITKQGVEVVKTDEHPRLRRIYGKDVLKKYKFFEDEFFGIDKTIMKIVRYSILLLWLVKNQDKCCIWLVLLGLVNLP